VLVVSSFSTAYRLYKSEVAAALLLVVAPACGASHAIEVEGVQPSASCEADGDACNTAETAVAIPTSSTATGQGAAAASMVPRTVEDFLETIPRGDPGQVVAIPEDDAAQFFNDKEVHKVDLTVNPDDLALIDSDPSAETYIEADAIIDGKQLGRVGLRYKGSAGAFIAPCTSAMFPGEARGAKVGKCSMKLDFDHVSSEQRFYGLKKLNLHAMGRDASLFREQLGYSLFREMGVATSRTTYSRVTINGELEGLFLGVEQVDGRFTRARFTEGGQGNLYKELWPTTLDPGVVRASLETNEEDDDTSIMSWLAFATAVNVEPSAALAWIDRDYMQRFIAVDRMILNDDGAFRFYCNNFFGIDLGRSRNHNFYWYESPVGTRMWLIPWDLDLSFAGALRTRVEKEWRDDSRCDCYLAETTERASPQRAPACDPLFAELRDALQDYDQVVDDLLKGPLGPDAVAEKLERWTKLLMPTVQETAGVNSAPSVMAWQEAIDTLRSVIDHSRETRGSWPGH
jgi:hypothetical protein